MTNNRQKLFTEFPVSSKEAWLEKVAADLKGADFDKKLVWRTPEGFNVQPMYSLEDLKGLAHLDTQPSEFPFLRGTRCDNRWLVRQNVTVTSPEVTNALLLEILSRGVTSLGLCLNNEQISQKEIATLLNGVDVEAVELNFSCCVRHCKQLAQELVAYFTARKIDLAKVRGSINYNPYKRILKRGKEVENQDKEAAELVRLMAPLSRFRAITVEGTLLSNAGAYITQELGFSLAWGNDYLARLVENGIDSNDAACRIKFDLGISSNFFMEIAKFRAGRMLWAQIVSAYAPKCPCAPKMKVNAETSLFNTTLYDPYVNLLRTQTEAMSAALAGVDSLVVNPFDAAYQPQGDDFSQRIARNQQLLLIEESHIDKVADPAGGSYYIENLTASIAQEAWKLFLEIEEKGGFYAAIQSGYVQEVINNTAKTRRGNVAQRKEILLGTNQYPNPNETISAKLHEATHSCHCGCKNDDTPQIATLCFDRAASDFEALRLATEHSSKRPAVFMLTIGNLAMRLARSQFSGNFFGCAGYQIIDNLGFNTIEEGVQAAFAAKADIIVLCSSDEEYATLAPQALASIGGKAELVVAGAPACAEELKAQGIDQFINVRSNVLQTLLTFQSKLSIR